MEKTVLIMGGFDGKQERIAMECDSVDEATNRLDKAFKKVSENLWVDRCGQEFSIKMD